MLVVPQQFQLAQQQCHAGLLYLQRGLRGRPLQLPPVPPLHRYRRKFIPMDFKFGVCVQQRLLWNGRLGSQRERAQFDQPHVL